MSANDGDADVVITYDDLTMLIQSVTTRNDGLGTYTIVLRDSLTDAVVFGPKTHSEGSGASTTQLSLLGIVVIPVGLFVSFPLQVTISWTP